VWPTDANQAAMNQTLQATRTTVVYDEFSLKLYFLAKDVLKEAVHISVTVQPGMTVSLFRNPAHFDLNASQSSVDALFEQFENWLSHGVAAVLDGVSRIDTMDKQRTVRFWENRKPEINHQSIASLSPQPG
jgi:hypothetical protein